MTEDEGAGEAPRDPGATDSARHGVARWALVVAPAAALLIGLGLGALLVGVGGGGSSGEANEDASPSPPDSAAASPGDIAVVVPQECREAAESVQQATTLIRDSVAALADFKAGQITSLLNQLEDLDAQAREQAAACAQVDVATISPTPNGATESPSD